MRPSASPPATIATGDARSAPSFRDDINGLRALAVLGVVVYHFRLGLLPGGFAGVDVFFVISGFLMTQIIAGRLARGTFSLAGFYAARIRRIVPAYVVLILCVMLAGLVLLDPWRLEDLARDAAWSLGFVSNYLYVTQGGYFALSPDRNWLVHTWSLAVEWQFYLVFPVLLLLLDKVHAKRPVVVAALAVLAVFSLRATLSSGYSGDKSLEASFYLLWPRAWEFLAGALCAIALPRLRLAPRLRTALHYAGLVLIAVAMLRFDAAMAWPSRATLVPVLGTVFVLAAGWTRPLWATAPPTARLGLWSYSIYLWHWPLAAACSSLGLWSAAVRLAGAFVSIGLGSASHALIERRATEALYADRRRLWRIGGGTFAAVLALAVVGVATRGTETIRFAFRPDIRAALVADRAARADWAFPQACDSFTWTKRVGTLCRFGDPHADSVLVIGDSFAEQIAPRYKALARGAPFGIVFATRGACMPIPGVAWRLSDTKCDAWVRNVYAFARDRDFKRVVVIAYWSLHDQSNLCLIGVPDCGADLAPAAFSAAMTARFDKAADLWRALAAQGKRVTVFDVMPDADGTGDPADLYRKALAGAPDRDLSIPLAAFERGKGPVDALLPGAAARAGVAYVDPAPAFCPDGRCPVVRHGQPLYKDKSHLRTSVVRAQDFTMFDRAILPTGGALRAEHGHGSG